MAPPRRSLHPEIQDQEARLRLHPEMHAGEEVGARPNPCLPDEMLWEILLRLPPQPSSLPRASAVCKRWHSLASDPGFCRRFRLHHSRSAPPLLGFFDPQSLSFVPTLAAPNRVLPDRLSLPDRLNCNSYLSCGSRHGLVLIADEECFEFMVWDPVTGRHEDEVRIPEDLACHHIMGMAVLREGWSSRSATRDNDEEVNFRVVLVAVSAENNELLACVYSRETETKLWGDIISTPFTPEDYLTNFLIDENSDRLMKNPNVLVGDSLYWRLCGSLSHIIEYDLNRGSLALIQLPVDMPVIDDDSFSVIREQGGGLGIFSVSDFTAQFWKRNTDRDGVGSWVLGRTIELDKMLSLDRDKDEFIFVMGYAEENNYVYLTTAAETDFMVQLQSFECRKMDNDNITKHTERFHPFESVYTLDKPIHEPEMPPEDIDPQNQSHIHEGNEQTVGKMVQRSPNNCNGQKETQRRKRKQELDGSQSLAEFGSSWQSGLRQSTRIWSRPLQEWRGERFLYGRINETMSTVIGIKSYSHDQDGKVALRAKSFVEDQYSDLVAQVAKY